MIGLFVNMCSSTLAHFIAIQCFVPRDSVEPRGERALRIDFLRLECQLNKRGLSGILRIVLIFQNAVANPHNQTSMAINQFGKAQLITQFDELV